MTTPTLLGPDASTTNEQNHEPEILRRDRLVLREILRLVAERAAAETKVEGARTSNDGKADAEYQRAHLALTEKYDRLHREAVAADAARRKGIVDGAIAAEAQAKGEFGSSSRKIAAEF